MMLKLKNSDFLVAKRSKRRQNKDVAGCMAGIVSIFDFRHGRITRRLLSDHTTHMTGNTICPSYPTSEVNSVMDSKEMNQCFESQDGDQQQTRVTEGVMEESDIHEHMEKTSKTSIDEQVPSQKTPQYHDLEDLMNELLMIHQKRNEEQKPNSLERSNSLKQERSNPRSDEPVTRRHQNFFRRRSKSHECISFSEHDIPHNERSFSHFSFTEIKKKLKNAIGRSPRDSGCREKRVLDGGSGWSSPNRDHFYSERFSKISNEFTSTQDEASRLCKCKAKTSDFGDTSDRISNIYVEAKKHLSEMLNNGDEDAELMVDSHHRTLGKLLSFPGYNSLSAGIEPKNEPDHIIMSRGDSPVVNESQLFVTDGDHQEPEVSDEGVLEMVKPPSPQENEVFEASDLNEEDELSCSPMATPSHAINRKSQEADDRTGKPSPVSVLEPLFSDDDISPARTISRSAEASIQPLRIQFEETVTPSENQETCIRNLVENEESAFEYVEAVLLASDLNWDDFEKRWLSSNQILDSSLYDELQIFSSRPGHDQRLLFDSTNEILKEVCDRSFGFFSELPFVKPKRMDLINGVWERIESRLNMVYPRSLDQLIGKDLQVSRMWMDLRSETQEIVIEIEEMIFEDLIDDTLNFELNA